MDGDVHSLRTTTGVFSGYDDIAAERAPSVMTTGYAAPAPEKQIYRLGIRIDMAVRTATAGVISRAPYYPEPNLLIRVRNAKGLRGLSFRGAGNGLEARRLVANGIRNRLIDPAGMVFWNGPPVVTSVPPRMRTAGNKGRTVINARDLSRKATLKALRGISQSHLFAKKWADNLYLALPISKPATTVTGPLMRMFQVFDPISLTYAYPAALKKNFSARLFTKTMNSYALFVTEVLRAVQRQHRGLPTSSDSPLIRQHSSRRTC